MTRCIFWLMAKTRIAQIVEKGVYLSIMCAAQNILEQRAFYGSTDTLGFVGLVGKGKLKPHAYDKLVMQNYGLSVRKKQVLSNAKLQIIIVTIKKYSSHIRFLINNYAMACGMMFIYCDAIVTNKPPVTEY